jgi:hypothetical protein
MIFYRIDTELKEYIEMDDVDSIDRLREYGERLAEKIDWEAILAGTDTPFSISPENTLWSQYKKTGSLKSYKLSSGRPSRAFSGSAII